MKNLEKNNAPQEFIIQRHGDKSLRFKGWLVHQATYRGLMYDGEIEYVLYQTTGGNFVVQEWEWNRAGCNDLKAKICKSETEVTKFLGQHKYAHKFYAECEIDNSVCVE